MGREIELCLTRAFVCDVHPEDEWAFDLLYCVAFMVMDKLWLDKNASYMDFNVNIAFLLVNYKFVHSLLTIYIK